MERHLIDLGGRLSEQAPKRSSVGIKISREMAMRREGQLLLWMTCNLACRIKNVIGEIEVCVPPDIEISAPRYMPFSSPDSNLKTGLQDALKLCARDCTVVFAKDDLRSFLDAVILIGPSTTTHAKAGFVKNVTCDGWLAYMGDAKDLYSLPRTDSNNPFGAFSAACIMVGEVFKFIGGVKPDHGAMIDMLCFSAYEPKCHWKQWECLENPPMGKTANLGQLQVCGAGAVAHAFCQALFPIDDLKGSLFFIDRSRAANCADERIDPTNLARYIMASNLDEGKPKAELLAKMMSTTGIQVGFSDEGLEEYVNRNAGSFSHVVSCVDNNYARHVIQDQIPKVIHGGSTEELRVQISIYDISSETCPCMKCYNPIEDRISDNDIRERLKERSVEQRKALATEKNIDHEKLEQYLQNPECGTLGNESIQKFAELDSGPEFSVNFVSALAGILLAAEVVKARNKSLKPVLDGKQKTDLYYRFWTNTYHLGISKPKPRCWCSEGVTSPRDMQKGSGKPT